MNTSRRSAHGADEVAAWSALVNVYQSVLHDVVGALEEQTGIDSGVFSVLAHLERAEPPHVMPMAVLQRAMHPRYSQSGFSRLVLRMETDGLVTRQVDHLDRRASLVVTTRRGQSRYESANAVYVEAVRAAFGQHLPAADHAALTTLLEGVRSAREAVDQRV